MTLDTYGHLFEDRLDEVGDAFDAARSAAQQRRADLSALPRVARARSEPKLRSGPSQRFPLVRAAFRVSTPDRIRTGATALRERLPSVAFAQVR